MIRSSVFEHILGPARSYNGDRFITAKSGTPLDILNGTICLNKTENEGTVDIQEVVDKILASSSNMDLAGNEQHSNEQGQIARYMSTRMSATIHNARNVVRPLVEELTRETEKRRAEILSGRALDRTIVIQDVSTAFSSSFLEQLLTRHREVIPLDRPVDYALAGTLMKDMTSENFLKIISTGNEMLDMDVRGLLEVEEPNGTSLLKRYARDPSGSFIADMISTASASWSPISDCTALAAYLFILGVKNGKHEAVELNTNIQLKLAHALNYFGNRLLFQIKQISADIEAGTLLTLGVNREEHGTPIMVFGPTYRMWLEEGGSPEALLGAISARPSTLRSDLNRATGAWDKETLDKWNQQYERKRNTQMAVGRLEANTQTTRFIRGELVRRARSMFEDVADQTAMIGRINAAMDARPYTDRDDLDLYILRLVCIVADGDRYDSELFIVTMRSLMADNETLTPTAAATMAATRLLGKWLASQMQVVSN